jgi:large subunit ribosomal protein L10
VDRAQKAAQIEYLEEVFATSGSVVVAHYAGMSVADMTKLRRQMQAAGATFKVAKNRLAVRALNAKGAGDASPLFNGPTGIAYANDPVAAPKVALAYSKENDKFKILGGVFGQQALDANGIKALAELPSLDELRAKIIGLIQAPAQKIASVVQAPAGQLARVFAAYAAKDEAAQ